MSKKQKQKSWWEVCDFAALGSGNSNDKFFAGWVTTGLYKKSLDERKTLHTQDLSGSIKDKSPDEIKKDLIKKFDLFNQILFHFDDKSQNESSILVREDAAIRLSTNCTHIEAEWYTTNDNLAQDIKKYLQDNIIKNSESKDIFVLMQSSFGLSVTHAGKASIPINESNYSPDVIKDIKSAINIFNKTNPKGRLLILNGPPGTGKTHLVKGLINSIDSGFFIIIPSNLISTIAGPQFIQPFLDIKRGNPESPIYMIVEDADQCLVPRGSDNLGDISSVLNLTDGILGSALDIRIIATTNAKKLEIDPALKRPGRLCKQIEVGYLTKQEANIAYKKITGLDNIPINQEYISLAEVYYAANTEEQTDTSSIKQSFADSFIKKDTSQQDKKIGFVNRSNE